jgi:hypothetical protein
MRAGLLFLFLAMAAMGQTMCPDTLVYSVCDIVFELNDAEAAVHKEPWKSVELSAEVKSPRFRTFLAYAFWDGGRKLIVRVAPTDDGVWELRLTSNIARFDKQTLKFNGLPSESPGFIQKANVHHWRYSGSQKAHLWLGIELWDLASAAEESFETVKAQGATHVRTLFEPVWPPDPKRFAEFEKRVQRLNADGVIVDIVLAGPNGALTRTLPDWGTREKYFRYAISRLAPLNVTWEIVKDWETYRDARTLLKDVGGLIQKLDPYQHPRSAYPIGSTSAFIRDGWMTHLLSNGDDPSIAAIEHQLYPLPVVTVGKRMSTKSLWNAIMAGSYLSYGASKAMSEVLGKTRYWELEPYFDVSNGRALALVGTEYLLYVDRPGIVEVEVEKHTYDAAWIDASTGERTLLKEYKGEHFIGEPPSKDREWLLHLSREGRKEGMLKSYKFESQPMMMQDLEVDPKRIPFTIDIKDNVDLKADAPIPYKVTITKDSRATRFMQYLITADVPTEMQGMRAITTSANGPMVLPASLATKFPAVLNLRVTGMNSNGKVYFIDRLVRLVK